MFLSSPIDQLTATLFLGLLLLAIVSDMANLRIPNRIPLALVALYPVHVAAAGGAIDWLGAVVVALAVFSVGAVGFFTGVLGGGDVKLLAAVALWCGPDGLAPFMLVTAVTGGAVALLMLSQQRFALAHVLNSLGERLVRDALLRQAIPYGVPIAIAGAVIAGGTLLRSCG